MSLDTVFEFVFTADLHSQAGRDIARAAQAKLRSGEIDNERKDTVGHGRVGALSISISRTDRPNEWTLIALPVGGDGYDYQQAATLRNDVLAALRANADTFKELPSELSRLQS